MNNKVQVQRPVVRLKKKHRMTVPLTNPEKELLYASMWRLWEETGGDAELACHEAGVRMTSECAAEFVLDAMRLEDEATRKGDTALEAALAKFRTLSWPMQVRFLLNRFTLA